MIAPPLRLAIVGCGAVADRYHLPAIEACSAVELVALVDPALDRTRRLAERYRVPHVLPEASGLAGLVDAAIVAAPNDLHARVSSDLLRQGVSVLVEKPLARTVAECDEIAAAARDGGAVVAVGHDFRYFPVARYTHELLRSGLLGEIEHVDLRQSATGRWPYASTYAFSRESSGGGVLIDFGVHMLDLLSWWLGDAHVLAYRDDAAGGVETECELELEFVGGARGSFLLTRLSESRDTSVIRGARGALEVGIFEPAVVRLTPAEGPTLTGDVADPTFARAPMRTVFVRQLEDFVASVRRGSAPFVTLEDGRRAVELVEACYRMREPLRRPWDWPEALDAADSPARPR